MKKYIPVVLIAAALLVGGIVFYVLLHKASNVNLRISPSVAKVVLNTGKTVQAGDFYVKPGAYTATVSYAGFETKKIDFNVKTSGKTDLIFILIPNSQAGYDYLNRNPKEQSLRTQLGTTQFTQNAAAQDKNTPIINDLPYIERYFRIDYGKSQAHPLDETAIGIYVTLYSSLGKQQALDWISKQGYDPSKLEIIYIDQSTDTSDPDS